MTIDEKALDKATEQFVLWHQSTSYPDAKPGECARAAEDIVSAYLSALPPSPVTPEGWRLVPVEPTEEMLAAGRDANDKYATELAPCSAFRALDSYRAMIAASPAQPKE